MSVLVIATNRDEVAIVVKHVEVAKVAGKPKAGRQAGITASRTKELKQPSLEN